MEKQFIRRASRPSLTSIGRSFLSKPTFYLNEKLLFEWEVKCAEWMPSVTIKVTAVGSGNSCKKDSTQYFSFPEMVILPEATAKHICVKVSYEIDVDWDSTTLGLHSLRIELCCFETVHKINQTFVLVKTKKSS